MDINNLVDIFKVEVLRNRPELNDFSSGSILYTLARAVALTANDVYLEVEQLRQSSLFIDSVLVNEELLASINPTLTKLPGSLSTGYVLISNLDSVSVTLPVNTILTDPISLTQFILTESAVINSITEVQIPIKSTSFLATANLPAGRNLINVEYPKLVFTIGEYRDIDNTFKGDVSGATSSENNLEYYNRIKDRLLNLRTSQKQVLVDYLLSLTDVNNVYIETLTGGLVLIWIKSSSALTSIRLEEINTAIQDYLPIGTYSSVKQLLNKAISITVQVYDETNLITDNYIKSEVVTYITSLNPSETLFISALRNLIIAKTGLIVKILSPASDVTLANNEKFVINNVEVLNVS